MADKPVRPVESIAEFTPRTVEVHIEREEDVLVFQCKALSFADWTRMNDTIPNPPPPIAGVDRLGRPVVNPSDPGYLKAKAEADHQRMLVRLQAFLLIDFPGAETPLERARAIEERMEPGLVRALDRVMSLMATEGLASATVRAKSFLPNGTGDYARVQEAGLDD